MPLKAIDELKLGEIITEPAINRYGQILIPPGTAVQEKHIKVLKIWNIHSVTVEGESEHNDKEFSEEVMKIARDKVIKRVNWEPSNTLEADLFDMAVLWNYQKLLFKGKS